MNHLNSLTLAFAQPPAGAGQPQTPPWLFGAQMLLMIVAVYFVLFRPQMKAKKEHEALIAALKTGDRVTLSSGILGTVTNVKNKEVVVVKIADNVKIEVLKSSITSINKEEAKEETK